jgi:hypothetical protein
MGITLPNGQFIECDPNQVSDGYHTFFELYEHRLTLFCAFLKFNGGWKSKRHHDGSVWDGWFIAGTEVAAVSITYHLPERLWDICPATEIDAAPEWDGHTSDDVLERLKAWLEAAT